MRDGGAVYVHAPLPGCMCVPYPACIPPPAVCWPKGSVAELIFTPMVNRIRESGGKVLGSKLVVGLETSGANGSGSITSVTARDTATGETSSHEADAVVFAIGITGEGLGGCRHEADAAVLAVCIRAPARGWKSVVAMHGRLAGACRYAEAGAGLPRPGNQAGVPQHYVPQRNR